MTDKTEHLLNTTYRPGLPPPKWLPGPAPVLPVLCCTVCAGPVIEGCNYLAPRHELINLPGQRWLHVGCEKFLIPDHWWAE